MQPKIMDVEQLKDKVRKLAAGHVLAGESAEACLDLAHMDGCCAQIAAGYGPASNSPVLLPRQRLMWILQGYVELHDSNGQVTVVRQGECTLLNSGTPYRLVFPQLTLYLRVEAGEGL